ncbi:MAG: DNA polymerase III subunit alpha [Bacteroidales bacterium]|nr:DNA polymerase III subunit alpha [Bacteroidales bacterium]
MLFTAHSYYSLRYGSMPVEQLVAGAKSYGLKTLVLADINNTSAITDFIRECNEYGIRPIAGVSCHHEGRHLYTLIASNNQGFRDINDFLSELNINGLELPERAPEFEAVFIVYPMSSFLIQDSRIEIQDLKFKIQSQSGMPSPRASGLASLESSSLHPDSHRDSNTASLHHSITASQLKPNEYIGICHYELNKFLTSPLRNYPEKLLAWHNITFADADGFELHRHLRAIDNNCLLSKLSDSQLANRNEVFLSEAEALRLFSQYPQLLSNAKKLLEQCELSFDFKIVKNKKTFTGSSYDDRILLEKLAKDGLAYRYGSHNKEALRRVKHELDIIDKLGFSAYFLITWDIIRYSMSRGFYHVGRGSGANSIVAYCLRITDVDPITLNLYFERFINPLRTSPPDFDIDYSWKERDEVLDYIFKRYGHKHTALLGAMSTFKGKSILRELGKVYGLPKNEIDDLVEDRKNPNMEGELINKIMAVGTQMTNFPNIRSIHAGGVLISEEPITCYTALDMPPKNFPTVQWDMYVAEAIGFEKLDILSQRGLGHIDECAKIVQQNRGITLDVHKVDEFMKDPQIKHQLRTGETIGCFYIESPAMRGLLKKLRCDTYPILVAASSIIRPGVARSGMMKEYIQRFHKPGVFKYIHPVMEEQLKETFGVMVYQEDVLKVCHHFAGLDLSDADILRRAMSGKFRSKQEFERIRDRFFVNCKDRGHSEAIAQEVWRQIESFAGYSFSKAHSASYAVESFQSLYLKAHFPHEFHVAVINNFGGFYETWVYFNEAKRCGAKIELPCVNHSHYKTSLSGQTIYTGFIHIQNLESKVAQSIEEDRVKKGGFKNLQDFVNRVPMGKEQLLLLIRTGAFRFTERSKQQLLWEAHMAGANTTPKISRNTLFEKEEKTFTLPELEHSKIEDAYDEIELLGFPVTLSYFEMLETRDEGRGTNEERQGEKEIGRQGEGVSDLRFRISTTADKSDSLGSWNLEFGIWNFTAKQTGKRVQIAGSFVCIKYVSTIRKEIMHFGTFFDRSGQFFDTVHFPPVVKKFPFRGKGVYLLSGKVVEEFGFASLEVEKMEKLPMKKDPRFV